jgi:hypothetical protein
MSNRFQERNVAHQQLSSSITTIATGGNNKELIAAPGANKRIKVYGFIIDNNGTGACDVILRFGASGEVIFDQTIPTGNVPLSIVPTPHYWMGGDNLNLQADISDQATDDLKITVLYQIDTNS